MSRWTSKRAILRDLSVAQGGRGPAPAPLAAAERPPPLALAEETEEEYFRHCVEDGVVIDKPDLGLIQQMLDMVRDLNVSDDDIKANDVALISKLNPCSSEFIPREVNSSPKKPPSKEASPLKNIPTTMSILPPKKPKRIRQRNIAMESIFQAIESREQTNDAVSNSEPLKLLKPEDFVPNVHENTNKDPSNTNIQNVEVKNSECNKADKDIKQDTKAISEAVDKVNDWMTQMMSPVRTKPVTVILEPTNMFKRKSKTVTSKPCVDLDASTMFKRKVADKSKVNNGTASSPQYNTSYVPSTQASHYYQKYLQKSQLMDSLNDDIWTEAEKKMKQIDEKKRIEAAQRAAEAVAGAEAEAAAGVEAEAAAGAEAEAVAGAEAEAEAAAGAEAEAGVGVEAVVTSSSSLVSALSDDAISSPRGWELVSRRGRAGSACAVCAAFVARRVPLPAGAGAVCPLEVGAGAGLRRAERRADLTVSAGSSE